MQCLKLLLVTLTFMCCANGAKILGVFHMTSYSHYIMGNRLMEELAKKGHDITVISAFEPKVPTKKYRTIMLTELKDAFKDMSTDMLAWKNLSIIEQQKLFVNMAHTAVDLTLSNSGVQNLLKSNEKFDLLIMEQFVNEAFRGFQHHYQVPCVIVSTIAANSWVNAIVGNPSMPSYIPDMATNYPENMTFCQRTINFLSSILFNLIQYYVNFSMQNNLLHKYFPDAPDVTDLIYNTSLVLVNSDVSINQAVPHVPNMIEIGGMHVKKGEKLPADLQKYLDNAVEGVVYFSMGSNLKSKDISAEKRKAITDSLGKLKMKVLWKWEEDNLPGCPENVRIGKWYPQQAVLAHPNVKLFVTHGGFLSTTEAVYFGKPIVGIPIFGDQFYNMQRAVNSGYGLMLDFNEINTETFDKTLDEILNNKTYAENAKARSKIMLDQPMSPLDRAVFWTEYVIRHKGAYHLRSTSLNLTWYQYLLLDVVGAIAFAIITPIAALCVVIKKIKQRKCCIKNNTKKDTKKDVKNVSKNKKKN